MKRLKVQIQAHTVFLSLLFCVYKPGPFSKWIYYLLNLKIRMKWVCSILNLKVWDSTCYPSYSNHTRMLGSTKYGCLSNQLFEIPYILMMVSLLHSFKVMCLHCILQYLPWNKLSERLFVLEFMNADKVIHWMDHHRVTQESNNSYKVNSCFQKYNNEICNINWWMSEQNII